MHTLLGTRFIGKYSNWPLNCGFSFLLWVSPFLCFKRNILGLRHAGVAPLDFCITGPHLLPHCPRPVRHIIQHMCTAAPHPCHTLSLVFVQEFFHQGDLEKIEGHDVMAMFDREKSGELAKGQLGFIDFCAGKHMELMSSYTEHLQWLYENVTKNRALWQDTLDQHQNAPKS